MTTSKTKSSLRTAITSISNSIKYPPLIANEPPQSLSTTSTTAVHHRPLEPPPPVNNSLNTEISSRHQQHPINATNNSPSSSPSSPSDALILKPSPIDPSQTAVVWLDNDEHDEDDNDEDDDHHDEGPSFLTTSVVLGMSSSGRCTRGPDNPSVGNSTSGCVWSDGVAYADIMDDADDEIPPSYEQVVNESAL